MEMDVTILVNRTHELPEAAVPHHLIEPEILFCAPAGDSRRLLECRAARAVEDLFARGKEESMYLCGVSGYRSYERQRQLYQKHLETLTEGRKTTGTCRKEVVKEVEKGRIQVLSVAPPGTSEHQTGLALDVSCPCVGYELDERFGETREGRWLVRHAPLFGFILRYPEGKEEITGYVWEPWHIRYVGRSLALYPTMTGLTMEEYYE